MRRPIMETWMIFELMQKAGVTESEAITALRIRECKPDLAEEYLSRRDYANAMSQADRYPKYWRYKMNKKTKDQEND